MGKRHETIYSKKFYDQQMDGSLQVPKLSFLLS